MTHPGGPTPVHEVVEAEGHLIDSHIMEQIFDTVVEYDGRFEVADPVRLIPLDHIEGAVRLAGAIWIGQVRLIDNILVAPAAG